MTDTTAATVEPAAVRRTVRRLAKVVLRDLADHKNKSRKLRKDANYVQSTPRCANCINFQLPLRIQCADGVKADTGRVCRLLVCRVETNGLCDHWTGHDGSTLEDGE